MNINMREDENKKFYILEAVFSVLIFIASYQGRLRSYNSTMLSLSYKNGFTSRALLGTIYHIIDKILPGNQINYKSALNFGIVITLLLIPLFIYFSRSLKRLEEAEKCLLLLLIFINISTYSGPYNFLRVDLFMLSVSLIAAALIIKEKAVFLSIPLSMIGVMFHQGYVFMYFNIVLLALALRFLKAEDKKERIRYGITTVLSFILSSALFLYFELFSRTSGREVYEKVREEAKALSYNGIYHTTLLAHEVLGVELNDAEVYLRRVNHLQAPVFLLFSLPFIIFFIIFIYRIIKEGSDKREKIGGVFYLIGSLTMLPDYILKCDYGRWVLSTITYYIAGALIMSSLSYENERIALDHIYLKIKRKPYALFMLLSLALTLPFLDVDISELMKHTQDLIVKFFPNIWDYL